MAGPGAITAMVLLAGRMNGDWRGLTMLMVIWRIILGSCVLLFHLSTQLERLLGPQGQTVLGRLLVFFWRRWRCNMWRMEFWPSAAADLD